jgi:hypothetical protein
MHWIEPALPQLFLTPDHNRSDIATELDANTVRQEMIKGYFLGTISGEAVDDCLAMQGINPHAFWEQVNQNVDELIAADTTEFEGLEKLLNHDPNLAAGALNQLDRGLLYPAV